MRSAQGAERGVAGIEQQAAFSMAEVDDSLISVGALVDGRETVRRGDGQYHVEFWTVQVGMPVVALSRKKIGPEPLSMKLAG